MRTDWPGQVWNTVADALKDLPQNAPLHEKLGGFEGGYLCDADNDYLKLMRTSERFPGSRWVGAGSVSQTL